MGCLTNNLETYLSCKAKKEKTIARGVANCVRILIQPMNGGYKNRRSLYIGGHGLRLSPDRTERGTYSFTL